MKMVTSPVLKLSQEKTLYAALMNSIIAEIPVLNRPFNFLCYLQLKIKLIGQRVLKYIDD
jgi:hypothetical protein